MSIPTAYSAVILVWATTPLGVVWSGETIHPVLAALLRMIIAAAVGVLILKHLGIDFPWHKRARKVYALSCIGVFGGMFCTYISAHHLSSSVVSVMYGLTPILSGILACLLLKGERFGVQQVLATLISFCGLAVIFGGKMVVNDISALALLLLGVLLFSISSILVKREQIESAELLDIHPFATALGAITLSIPAYTFAWLLMEQGDLHIEAWETRSILSVIYLALLGSLIGFFSYYYILKHLETTKVALITLVTPLFALAMGHIFNQEQIDATLIYGASLVIAGLGVFFWGEKLRLFR